MVIEIVCTVIVAVVAALVALAGLAWVVSHGWHWLRRQFSWWPVPFTWGHLTPSFFSRTHAAGWCIRFTGVQFGRVGICWMSGTKDHTEGCKQCEKWDKIRRDRG